MKVGSPEDVSVVFDVVKIWDVEVNVLLREMSKKQSSMIRIKCYTYFCSNIYICMQVNLKNASVL